MESNKEKNKDLPGNKGELSDTSAADNNPNTKDVNGEKVCKKPQKPRLRILRVFLWSVLGLLAVSVALPVLVYLPPVQNLLVRVACDVVHDKTGMNIGIEKFRLKWPLDISLRQVCIIEASGDTMVTADEALADVKLRPLFNLDVQLNKLSLKHGYYRMVSPDSSMIMKIKASELVVRPGSSVDLNTNTIDLLEADLHKAQIALYMDVWKQKPTPDDPENKPWKIRIGKVNLDDLSFGLSMLPTIDTLHTNVKHGVLEKAVIDLNTNKITAANMSLDRGKLTYITPTEQYVKSHPLPVDTTSQKSSEPMTIKADSLCISNFAAVYAVKGAKPLPGFDAAYISVDNLNARISDFYNRAAELRLPIESLTVRERCGLNVTACSGLVAIDSAGITLDNFKVRTPVSAIDADAFLSYSMMAMQKNGSVNIKSDGYVGFSDIFAFMPTLKSMMKPVPQKKPLRFTVDAKGTLASIGIGILNLDLPGAISLTAKGNVDNVMEPEKLHGAIDFNGYLAQPSLVAQMVPDMGIHIPTMRIVGNAVLAPDIYTANIEMLSPQGDAALDGTISLGDEGYSADFQVNNLNLGYIMPELGLGHLSASISAEGEGFDFTDSDTWTNLQADVTRLEYQGHSYDRITAEAVLETGAYNLNIVSYDPLADLEFSAAGNIENGLYDIDAKADIANIDLKELGFSEDINGGNGVISVSGTANPEAWLYDLKLDVSNFDWNLQDQYIHLPQAVAAEFVADEQQTFLCLKSLDIDADFKSPTRLKALASSLSTVMDSTNMMIENRRLDVEMLQRNLPQFTLDMNVSGKGQLQRFLNQANLSMDTISLQLDNAEKMTAGGLLYNLKVGDVAIDTLNMSMNQRNKLLNYRVHMGNRPGTLDDFARVDLSGYLGGNRASLSIKQQDIKGKIGYKLGATTAFMEDNVEVHFTPLDATIAYMPWTFNDDNFVQYTMANNTIHALLYATSNESKIEMKSEPDENGDNAVCIKLDNIFIEDFLKLSMTAPPVKGTINSDIDLVYKGNAVTGSGYINTEKLTYDRMLLGDFDFNFDADLDFEGNTKASISLLMNKHKVLTGRAVIDNDTVSKKPVEFDLDVTSFPLKLLNPFVGDDAAKFEGDVAGKLVMTGSFIKPILNGHLKCSRAAADVKMIGTKLELDSVPITVKNSVLDFNNFSITAANKNPLKMSGTVDARNLGDILIDVGLRADNMQLVGNDKRSGSDIYGKLFYNLNATAKGSLKYLQMNANMTILSATDVFYNLDFAEQQTIQSTGADVVKFVNLRDTAKNAGVDSVNNSMNMKIGATLTIQKGARVTVNLSGNGTDRVVLNPSGTLTYAQNVMGDMRLNGQLNTGQGMANYSIPAIGAKHFELDPASYVLWNGNPMNPILHIDAVDRVKANVSTSGQASRTVTFDVALSVGGTLSAPKVLFDLSTQDDMSIQNELQSMSADQRSNQAMNLMLYGAYTGAGTKTDMGINGEGMLYSFLESKLNSWMANNVRGVDISFGIDQYNTNNDGQQGSAMSYSYQVSKSLFNNRFKIVVGGNYSTDSSADENFAQNLISDVSFEYTFKQTNSLSIVGKLFRHTGFESILEGQISEMGVGVVMRRKLSNLKQLFRFRNRRRRSVDEDESDTIPGIHTNRFPTAPVNAPKADTTSNEEELYY